MVSKERTMLVFGRVGKSISSQASHRTVRESLPSYGSCYTNLISLQIVANDKTS